MNEGIWSSYNRLAAADGIVPPPYLVGENARSKTRSGDAFGSTRDCGAYFSQSRITRGMKKHLRRSVARGGPFFDKRTALLNPSSWLATPIVAAAVAAVAAVAVVRP